MIVWDDKIGLPPTTEDVLVWQGYVEGKAVSSILIYVEKNAERLRSKYLKFIHDLGNSKLKGKCLIEHLAIEDGLSYWWLTAFAEKSPWKSTEIFDCIRILALEEVLIERKPKKIRLVSRNQYLHQVISELCGNLKISYEWDRLKLSFRQKFDPYRIFHNLPQPIQALVSFFKFLSPRFSFRKVDKTGWKGGDSSIFFCSYFDNINLKSANQGAFQSYYWEGLPQLLSHLKFHSNWLQIFVPSPPNETAKLSINRVKRINQKSTANEFHSFIEGYLSVKIILAVIKRWIGLMIISFRLHSVKESFVSPGNNYSFWPLLKLDWYKSMRGLPAIHNLLQIELFDKVMKEIPTQQKGFYLCENHAWERAMIHSWRKYSHGQLIAFQHAVIRFWDLRYFNDNATLRDGGKYAMPQPDLIALNGQAAIESFKKVSYPEEKTIECEALRYNYLYRFSSKGLEEKKIVKNQVKVLVLGDYVYSNTDKLLKLLESANKDFSLPDISYTLKPHPNCPIDGEKYKTLNLNVVNDPLEKIIENYDIAYCGNLTSASLDAYLAGLPVIIMLDENDFNFSPLRGQRGVDFVINSADLTKAFVNKLNMNMQNHANSHDFFFLDSTLPKWATLLKN